MTTTEVFWLQVLWPVLLVCMSAVAMGLQHAAHGRTATIAEKVLDHLAGQLVPPVTPTAAAQDVTEVATDLAQAVDDTPPDAGEAGPEPVGVAGPLAPAAG